MTERKLLLTRLCSEIIEKSKETVSLLNEVKETPLHCAAEGDHDKVVALLLANGADKMAKDGRDNTPLALAASNGAKKTVAMLLQEADSDRKGNAVPAPCALIRQHLD